MNRVVEVSYEAEEVTGHPFSLALTAADRVHFLKGTSREESKWWFDILSMFPRTNMKVCFLSMSMSSCRVLLHVFCCLFILKKNHKRNYMMGNWPCDWPAAFSFPFFYFWNTFLLLLLFCRPAVIKGTPPSPEAKPQRLFRRNNNSNTNSRRHPIRLV